MECFLLDCLLCLCYAYNHSNDFLSLHADAVVGRAVGMLMKANDTSTAESGSELEELTSPKTNMNSYVAKLTPVSENVGFLNFANGKKSPTVLFEYEDCVPMVVKVVDVAWESQEMSNASEGIARAELGDEPNARESRPPSPSRPSTFNERVIISYVLSRQGDLEKQIEALHLRKYRDASRLRGVDCKTRSQ
ncbi:hypothetical protein Bca52824_014377 [Brassica carinata]|uniref:Uncharacterized protein n=1 Tax=Brassica carinata TaxID=52824 RepID=A0A8X7VZZ8_BRACI|nr:hypothetical protein Bca52824_014377 [Brassica carinata]